ncbi:MAG: hypothetical protein HY360_12820 [Verrucomicrobia bacterium]|nr:hypothetical protein [Verrucomicrobiota bacterium]
MLQSSRLDFSQLKTKNLLNREPETVNHATIHTFTLRDCIHHSWTRELVTYEIELPPENAAQAILADSKENIVPVQIQPSAGGRCSVSFVVDLLPADGEAIYALQRGMPSSAPLIVRAADSLILDGGTVAARVPAAGAKNFSSPVPLRDLPAPLLAVRGRSGTWIGAGAMKGEALATAARCRIVADGPIFAEVEIEYLFHGGKYAARVRVVRGSEAVQIREEFEMAKDAANGVFFSFSLTEGLRPDRVAADVNQVVAGRSRADARKNRLGLDCRLEFGEPCREMSILGYLNWWPETAQRATFYRAEARGGDAVSVLPTRIGWWRNPMGMYVMTARTNRVSIDLPLRIEQEWARDGVEMDGAFYTGSLEEGWPRQAGRRAWILHCTTIEAALPASGPSSVLETVVKECSLPLDKVKDWILDWPQDPGVTHPRLFIEPGQLEEIRARLKKSARAIQHLTHDCNRPAAYVITQDPTIAHELLWSDTYLPDRHWDPFAAMGVIRSLRQYVAGLMEGGYLAMPAPNNWRPTTELLKFDAAMSIPDLSDAERAELRQMMAFVVNMVADEDWHPTKAGFHRGNVNMPPRQEHHLGMASWVFADHPLAPVWRRRGEAEAKRMIETMVREGGAWRENPHYHYLVGLPALFQSAVQLHYANGFDLFSHPKLKANFEYLMAITTPPDPRFGIRVVAPFGTASWGGCSQFGWAANLTRKSDPPFSRRMQWMWREQGRPGEGDLVIDPDLPTETPALRSASFPGFGVVLRCGFPSKEETWVAFRMGENVEHYNFGDQGSFMMYAKGAPLVLSFGSAYTPQLRGAWFHNRVSIGHEEVRDGLMGGTEFFSQNGDPEYAGRITHFVRLPTADYTAGRHVSRRQGLAPERLDVLMPSNVDFPAREIPPHTWTRQMLLVKSLTDAGDDDPCGPTYLTINDTIESPDPLGTEWNLWLMADSLELETNPARGRGRFGVALDLFMATPLQPRWTTREFSHTFLYPGDMRRAWRERNGDAPYIETLRNLRLSQPPGRAYVAVLYPRKTDEPPAQFRALADGLGAEVVHPRGKDAVFIGLQPLNWAEADWEFRGTAGVIRQERTSLSLTLAAAGEIRASGIILRSAVPASLRVTGRMAALVVDGPVQAAQLTLPEGIRLQSRTATEFHP